MSISKSRMGFLIKDPNIHIQLWDCMQFLCTNALFPWEDYLSQQILNRACSPEHLRTHVGVPGAPSAAALLE